jgi:hypothetical protein
VAQLLSLLGEDTLDRIGAGPVGRVLPRPLRRRTGKRVHTSAAILSAPDRVALYDLLMRVHRDGPTLAPGGSRRPLTPETRPISELPPVELGMAADTVDYMPNDILVKVDRAAMSTSLETRAPLLDHRLHAFARSLRPDQRVRDGSGKWIMREAARSRIPAIADLPKRGFAVPLDSWLRGPLKQWAGDILAPDAIASGGVLDPTAVQSLWHRHQSGAADRSADLWPILMLEAWRGSGMTERRRARAQTPAVSSVSVKVVSQSVACAPTARVIPNGPRPSGPARTERGTTQMLLVPENSGKRSASSLGCTRARWPTHTSRGPW